MKFLIMILAMCLTATASADSWYTQADSGLGVSKKVKCGMNLTCTKSSGQVTITKAPIVTLSTNTTLTASQCGSIITNSAAATATLPEASTVLGCEFTFIVGNASNLGPNPADASDQIVLLTNAAGDSLLADAVGESVTIVAVAANVWAPVGAVQGTWTDSN